MTHLKWLIEPKIGKSTFQTTYQPQLSFNSFFNPINPNYFNQPLLTEPIQPIKSDFDLTNQLPVPSADFSQEAFNYFPLKSGENSTEGSNILTY